MCTRWQFSLVSDFYIYEGLDYSVVCQISLCAALGKTTYILFLMCSDKDVQSVLLTASRNTHSLEKRPQWQLGSASQIWMQHFSGLELLLRLRNLTISLILGKAGDIREEEDVMKDTAGDASPNHSAWNTEECKTWWA